MANVNFKRELKFSVDEGVKRVEEKFKAHGFGVLTRIDFHSKIKEKLGKDISPTVILGVCNPQLAFEAFQKNTDVTSLMPCNVVVRDIGNGRISVEVAKATAMTKVLEDKTLTSLMVQADTSLEKALEEL